MQKELIMFTSDDVSYIAAYSKYFETITVREADTAKLVYRKYNVNAIEWKFFKLRLKKWKRPAQDVEDN